jgi:hypothetical protein
MDMRGQTECAGYRNKNHWLLESYKQRMTTRQWRDVLLNNEDKIIFRGRLRQLIAIPVGAGVVEVGKRPERR